MSKNYIEITKQLDKAQHNKAKYKETLAAVHLELHTLTESELSAKANYAITYTSSLTTARNLKAEQTKLQEAIDNQNAYKGVLGKWDEHVKQSQKNYDIVVSNEAQRINNLKICDSNIAQYIKNYDVSNRNKATAIKNIENFDIKINKYQSAIQTSEHNKVDCLKIIGVNSVQIQKYQNNISQINDIRALTLNSLNIINEKLPVLVQTYGNMALPGDVKPENYYHNKIVTVKHRTSILGINADPYYTSHTERVFDQERYNKAAIATNNLRNQINHNKKVINDLTNLKNDCSTKLINIDNSLGELQSAINRITQNTQINNEIFQKNEACISRCHNHLNQITPKKQQEVEHLKQIELDIIKYKESLDKGSLDKQKYLERMKQAEGDVTKYKTLLSNAVQGKENVEKTIADSEAQIALSRALIAQFTEKQKKLEESLRSAIKEIELISKSVQIKSKQEKEFVTKLTNLDTEINDLESKCNLLDACEENDLATLTENMNLQAEAKEEALLVGYHVQAALAGDNLETALL